MVYSSLNSFYQSIEEKYIGSEFLKVSFHIKALVLENKVNSRNLGKKCEINSKSTIKILERPHRVY